MSSEDTQTTDTVSNTTDVNESVPEVKEVKKRKPRKPRKNKDTESGTQNDTVVFEIGELRDILTFLFLDKSFYKKVVKLVKKQ